LRKLIAVLTVAAVLGGLAVLGSSVATGERSSDKATTKTVKVGDDFFSPTKRTIYQRDIIKWVWVGADGQPGTTASGHTVTEANDRFSSEEMTSGTYRKRFKKRGTYNILCATHPSTMRMKVVVKRRPSS
jgi:plastocyanin